MKLISKIKRWLAGVVIIMLVQACNAANAPVVEQTVTAQPTLPPSQSTTTLITGEAPIADIAATVTAVRKVPTRSTEQLLPYVALEEMVKACDAFHTKRQLAVLQHISWLANPQAIPPEFIALYGNEASAKLAFGAAYLVAVQWKTDGRQPESCLIPIGRQLNEMVIGLGGKPAPEFMTP